MAAANGATTMADAALLFQTLRNAVAPVIAARTAGHPEPLGQVQQWGWSGQMVCAHGAGRSQGVTTPGPHDCRPRGGLTAVNAARGRG